ncbi:hypothetical protein N657DRAFT_679615 [Parathielavia appendiculata]|uniref:Uncharacterized protein n=1 Tax=Parathielavia appendiculata TaxID=2587402 RepID=A0AAN6Z4L7_9PEZI|nr:hypothetical protein N657DRAFT_679615 [Parathielavia appendiculata]
MGLFSRHAEPTPQPQPVYEQPPKKHGLFGSRHQSPPRSHTTNTSRSAYSVSPDRDRGSGGVFRRSTDASHNGSHRSSGGLLHRSFGNGNRVDLDPSIVQAQERLRNAESAEMEADRALIAARESVREAREHVRRLELEAQEEARRAKIKQHHAKDLSKRGKQLGRYGN